MNYDELVKEMEDEIKEGLRCTRCGKVILREGQDQGAFADDEICTCN